MPSSAGGRRVAAAFGAALIIASSAAVLVIDAPTATAFTQNRITLTGAHRVVDAEFGPIAGTTAETGVAVTPTPTGCGNTDGTPDSESPPPFGTQCDTIPLHVVPPTDMAPSDDFVVTIVLTWEDAPGKAADEEGTVTDLDMHFYDNGQIKRRADPESTSTTQLTESAGATIPESVKVCCPDLGDYNIVVVNAGAASVPKYRIHAEMKTLKSDKIYELLAESPTSPTGQADSPGSLPEDLSNVALPVGIEDLADVPGLDADFGDFGAAPLEKALQGLPDGTETVGVTKPSPVSGTTVALALGLIPIVGAASAAVFALRRRNAATSLL